MEDKITKAKKIINIVDKIKGTFFLTAIILLLFVFLYYHYSYYYLL